MRALLRRSDPLAVAPILLAAAAIVAMTLGAATAAAHGDEGELTLTRLEATGPTTVAIEVGIVYEGDGHLAESATVSATLTGPGGAAVGPLALERTGDTTSLYAASTEVPPGEWSVQVTSTDPTGEVSGTVSVTGEPIADTAQDPSPDASGTEADPTTDDRTDAPEAFDGDAAVTTATPVPDDGGSDTALIVGLVAAAVVLVGGGVAIARGRRQGEPTG